MSFSAVGGRVQIAPQIAHTRAISSRVTYSVNNNKTVCPPVEIEDAIIGRDLDAVKRLWMPYENLVNSDHKSPLDIAVEHGREEIFRYLLDHGANPNASPKRIPTAHLACELGRPNILRLLAKHDADITSSAKMPIYYNRTSMGLHNIFSFAWRQTPAERARRQGHGECLAILKEFGVEVPEGP